MKSINLVLFTLGLTFSASDAFADLYNCSCPYSNSRGIANVYANSLEEAIERFQNDNLRGNLYCNDGTLPACQLVK